jgi:hypothetical protein
MNKENIIDRIRKLFALGDRNKNPNEGEVKTALSMVSKLMKEYNLSLSEIDLEKQKDTIGKEYTEEQNRFAFWERKLAKLVGKLFDCSIIVYGTYSGNRKWIFVGFIDDAKLSTQCYKYLDDTIRIMANIHAKNKLDFYAGITDRLKERIDEEIKLRTPEEAVKCTAIVCCKNKLINTWKEKNMKLSTEHRTLPRINNVSADYYKGYLVGANIDLQNKEKLK